MALRDKDRLTRERALNGWYGARLSWWQGRQEWCSNKVRSNRGLLTGNLQLGSKRIELTAVKVSMCGDVDEVKRVL